MHNRGQSKKGEPATLKWLSGLNRYKSKASSENKMEAHLSPSVSQGAVKTQGREAADVGTRSLITQLHNYLQNSLRGIDSSFSTYSVPGMQRIEVQMQEEFAEVRLVVNGEPNLASSRCTVGSNKARKGKLLKHNVNMSAVLTWK